MIEPVFEKISFDQIIDCEKEQIKVNCKTGVLSEEVEKVLSVCPFCFASSGEVGQNSLKYSGKITFYLTYLDKEGSVKKCECGNEFNGEIKIDYQGENAKASIDTIIEKTEHDLSGAYLSVSGVVSINAKLFEKSVVGALVGGDGLIVDGTEQTFLSSLGKKWSNYPMEEEFELSFPVEEVLFHRAEPIITASQCGVGTIIVDGQVLLSLVLLQNSEKKDIIKESRVLPFRMEIECEDAMPSMLALARVKQKSLKTDVGVDQADGTSVVKAYLSLFFEGEAFLSTNAVYAKDLFSTKSHLDITAQNCVGYIPREQRAFDFLIGGVSSCAEIPLGANVVAVCQEDASVLSVHPENEGLEITGAINAIVYLKDAEGKAFTRKVELGFTKRIDGEFEKTDKIEACITAHKGSARIVSNEEMEIECQAFITLHFFCPYGLKVITGVKELGERAQEECAISVYLGLEGEEKFALAKRLNVCPDTLLSINQDLQFPLVGDERIVVYRQK